MRASEEQTGRTIQELAVELGLVPTSDPIRKNRYGPRSQGKRTGLGICRFWALLFVLNEKLDCHKKMTDAEIQRQVIQEYPDRPVARKLQRKKITVNQHRTMYNSGRFTPEYNKPTDNDIEVPYSYRYNSDGRRVDGRTGLRILPTEPPNQHLSPRSSLQAQVPEFEDMIAGSRPSHRKTESQPSTPTDTNVSHPPHGAEPVDDEGEVEDDCDRDESGSQSRLTDLERRIEALERRGTTGTWGVTELEPVGVDFGYLILRCDSAEEGHSQFRVKLESLQPFTSPPSQRQRAKCEHTYQPLDEDDPAYRPGWRYVCSECGQKARSIPGHDRDFQGQ